MANTAIDNQTLSSQDGVAQAAWAGRDQDWIAAHNSAIGFHNNPDEQFQVAGVVKSITTLGVELTSAGYTGPWDRGSVIAAYARTSGSQVLPYTTAVAHPTGTGRGGTATYGSGAGTGGNGTGSSPVVGGVSIVGNPWQWLQQKTNVLGVALPNWALAGGAAYFFMGRRRR